MKELNTHQDESDSEEEADDPSLAAGAGKRPVPKQFLQRAVYAAVEGSSVPQNLKCSEIDPSPKRAIPRPMQAAKVRAPLN